jgi:hypothetical protein
MRGGLPRLLRTSVPDSDVEETTIMDNDAVHGHRPRGITYVAISALVAIMATLVGTAAVAGAVTSSAAEISATKSSRAIPLVDAARATVHGVAEDGSEFNGTFQLRRFRERGGTLYAVGRLQGVLGTGFVNQGNVALPVTGATNEAPGMSGLVSGLRQQPEPTPGACDILTLALGPLDLDILGLRVALDEVNLLIEAIPGAGNLLGNLLCGIAGLLDGGLGSGIGGLLQNLLDAIADLLNGLLGA